MIATIKAEIQMRALDFRRLVRLVDSPEFEEALKLDPDNVWVKFALASGNVQEVKEWIEDTLVTEVGEMSMRQLRKRAAMLDIPRYTHYLKDELIVRIIREHDAQKLKNTPRQVPLSG